MVLKKTPHRSQLAFTHLSLYGEWRGANAKWPLWPCCLKLTRAPCSGNIKEEKADLLRRLSRETFYEAFITGSSFTCWGYGPVAPQLSSVQRSSASRTGQGSTRQGSAGHGSARQSRAGQGSAGQRMRQPSMQVWWLAVTLTWCPDRKPPKDTTHCRWHPRPQVKSYKEPKGLYPLRAPLHTPL